MDHSWDPDPHKDSVADVLLPLQSFGLFTANASNMLNLSELARFHQCAIGLGHVDAQVLDPPTPAQSTCEGFGPNAIRALLVHSGNR